MQGKDHCKMKKDDFTSSEISLTWVFKNDKDLIRIGNCLR